MSKASILLFALLLTQTVLFAQEPSLKVETLKVLGEKESVKYLKSSKNTADCDLFLKTFTNSDLKSTVLELKEQFFFINSYDVATKTFNVDTLNSYITVYPKGKYIQQVSDAVDIISWQKAHNKNTVASYTEYLKNFPNGKAKSLAQKRLKSLQ